MSDAQYDELFRELADLEKSHPEELESSPTQTVGHPPPENRANLHAHSVPMLSLANTYDPEGTLMRCMPIDKRSLIVLAELSQFDTRVRKLVANSSSTGVQVCWNQSQQRYSQFSRCSCNAETDKICG